MISLKRHSSRPVLRSIHDDTRDGASSSNYVERDARRTARRDRWSSGFLSANGIEIPLFVRQQRLLTK